MVSSFRQITEPNPQRGGSQALKSFYYEKPSLHRRERIAGSFDRTITLPLRVDPDGINPDGVGTT
jgi:HSP20 family molecular chaperone IbpA